MNRMEQALFELRLDLARNPGGLERAELDYLLAHMAERSDQNLAATATLFGLDLEVLTERAAILEYDGGVSRPAANRQAAQSALQTFDPELSDKAARWAFTNSAAILDWESSTGATRQQTADALRECIEAEMYHRLANDGALAEPDAVLEAV